VPLQQSRAVPLPACNACCTNGCTPAVCMLQHGVVQWHQGHCTASLGFLFRPMQLSQAALQRASHRSELMLHHLSVRTRRLTTSFPPAGTGQHSRHAWYVQDWHKGAAAAAHPGPRGACGRGAPPGGFNHTQSACMRAMHHQLSSNMHRSASCTSRSPHAQECCSSLPTTNINNHLSSHAGGSQPRAGNPCTAEAAGSSSSSSRQHDGQGQR